MTRWLRSNWSKKSTKNAILISVLLGNLNRFMKYSSTNVAWFQVEEVSEGLKKFMCIQASGSFLKKIMSFALI